MLRSLNSYYFHSVLENICLLEKPTNKRISKIQKSQTVSYKLLAKEIENIDIGKLHDISELCRNTKSLNGMHRLPT